MNYQAALRCVLEVIGILTYLCCNRCKRLKYQNVAILWYNNQSVIPWFLPDEIRWNFRIKRIQCGTKTTSMYWLSWSQYFTVGEESLKLHVNQVHAENLNKRPMGHIAHLRKQFNSINTYEYIITLIRRRRKNY